MMPVFVVMQTNLQAYGEVHDTLDNRWAGFFIQAGILPIYLPNNLDVATAMLSSDIARGAIFTGGGEYSLDASDTRSQLERLVMDWSVQHGYPLIGVCRGMQAMLLYKGAQLRPCLGQVCAQQQILFCQQVIKVNSYHQFECINIPAEFEVIGTGDNGMVKAVKGKQLSWLAIMWHPERLMPQRKQDLQLFNQFLTQGAVCKD